MLLVRNFLFCELPYNQSTDLGTEPDSLAHSVLSFCSNDMEHIPDIAVQQRVSVQRLHTKGPASGT